jgi:NAD-dependent SIR2 family protein deacetylase
MSQPGAHVSTFKNSDPTTQKIHCHSVAKSYLLILSKEIIIYGENHTKHIHATCVQSAEHCNAVIQAISVVIYVVNNVRFDNMPINPVCLIMEYSPMKQDGQ